MKLELVIPTFTVFVVSSFAELPEHPLEPAATSCPGATLYSFIETINHVYDLVREQGRGEVEPAERKAVNAKIFRHMDVSGIPEHIRIQASAEAAACLKEVLDRVEIPPLEEIPGAGGEDLPAKWRIPHTDITIERVVDGSFAGEYQFSAHTVGNAVAYYKRIENYPYRSDGPPVTQGLYAWFATEPGSAVMSRIVGMLPASFRARWGAHSVWQWVGLVIVLAGGIAVMMLGYRIGRMRERRFKGSNTLRYVITLIFPILIVLVPVWMKMQIRYSLMISGKVLLVTDFLLGLILLFAIMAVIWGIGSRLAALLVASPQLTPQGLDAQFIRLICRILSIVAVVVVFLEGGQRLGIPLSTLLAGAGISGFAIAMAAQDSLKNILGSMMITLDKPYSLGERIKVNGYDGVIEDIGLRSTKIRLLNGHQTIIPNDEMARSNIENIARRPFIRRVTEIPLALDITSTKASRAVALVEELLKDHEGFKEEFQPRVWLNDFKRDHLELKMIYWYHPPDYWDFTAHADRINREILDAFESEGIAMALPAFTTHLEDSSGLPVTAPSRHCSMAASN